MRLQNSRRGLWGMIGLITLIIILFVVFVDLQTVVQQLRHADWRYALVASVMLMAGLAAYAVRWRLLLANKPSYFSTFHAANVGHTFNILIPLRAGEAARIIMLGRSKSVSLVEVTSSVVVERLFEQIMRLTALGGAIVFGLQVSTGTLLGGLAFLGIALGGVIWLTNHQAMVLAQLPVWLARLPRMTEARACQMLTSLLDGLAGVASPRRLALALLWSTVAWACFWSFYYLALLALSVSFQPSQRLAISLGALALSPPSAPTQPGVYHASVVVPLSIVGFDEATLTSYAVIVHALQVLWMVGLGVWGLSQTGASLRELSARSATPPNT